MSSDSASKALDDARNAVMVKSTNMSSEAKTVQGYDFNKGLDYDTLLQSMLTTGYQATHFGRAVDIVNKMITWRLSQETKTEEDIEAEVYFPIESYFSSLFLLYQYSTRYYIVVALVIYFICVSFSSYTQSYQYCSFSFFTSNRDIGSRDCYRS